MPSRPRLGTLLALVGAALPPMEPVRPGYTVDIFDPPPPRPYSAPQPRESNFDRSKRRGADELRKEKKRKRKMKKKTRGW